MLEEIGIDNFFLFGLTAEQVLQLKRQDYDPQHYIRASEELRKALAAINSKTLVENPDLFKPLLDILVYQDEFMVCADFKLYVDCQNYVGNTYCDRTRWIKMSILNTARMGKLSSGRAIREYYEEMWNIKPVLIRD